MSWRLRNRRPTDRGPGLRPEGPPAHSWVMPHSSVVGLGGPMGQLDGAPVVHGRVKRADLTIYGNHEFASL